MKQFLLFSFLLLGLVPPAQAQFATREDCTAMERVYDSGFCLSSNSPSVFTLGEGREIIGVFRAQTDYGAYYVITIAPLNAYSSQDEAILSMILDSNRDVIHLEKGNTAIAEKYRYAISTSLDIIESWHPSGIQRF
ncbi:MAG: hypothetical protein DCF21_05260 [Leptolyngbya sp.]|uniref:Uncharacterized protein n=1 Tax=Shackletoniella antarctica TaxID=268115 RepID=A0A2W4WEL2_9CYAN|nr:MAG: hypothetical protein DCF17_07260 [Shackletoniella antarctica]PZV20298.1 MAG: hypothetical protein DCF21_05260 [Leptolyngbya sp.]